MLINRLQWAAACSHAASGFAGARELGGSGMSTSVTVAVATARKPRITDAGNAQGDSRAWSPPV